MLITTEQAKAHLRVDAADLMVDLYLGGAELSAIGFLNRYVYADQAALTGAIAAAPAALSAATAAYEAAMAAAVEITNAVEYEMAKFAANEAYADAQSVARMTYQGIVINDNIKAAILLILGHLYENREDSVVGTIAGELPMGSRFLLQPYRVGMGV